MSTSSSSSEKLGDSENQERMGVAAMSSKRRLENCDGELEGPSPTKIAKKSVFIDTDQQDLSGQHDKFSSEFLTTSILARTLLTSSNSSLSLSSSNPHHVLTPSSPLESLKSSLESLPTTSFLESMEVEELHGGSYHLSASTKLQPVHDATELEFNGLLCHDRSLTTITVLSPIDEGSEGSSWSSPSMSKMSPFGMMSEQVITEDENGKSYFNLGPSEATVLAKKSSTSNPGNSPPDQTWTANENNVDYMDENSSSSSCESISSEDLFNSCEEYDISDDEEEVRTYKQERSNVLHLSLCKLNMFRTQQCVEPSLHRSVLICNTLRHIEQEIRNEDEVRHTEPSFLESRETIPPFWPPTSTSNNNTANNNANAGQITGTASPEPVTSSIPPASTPDRPASKGGHDPYLSPSSYNDSPYSAAYDYNNPLRPSQTPFHTASYEYSEPELPSPSPLQQSSPILAELVEDMDAGMSAYYYPTPVQPEFSAPCGGNESAGYMACSSPYDTMEPSLGLVPASSVASIVETLSSELGSSASDMGDIIPSASNPSSLASSNDSMNNSDYLDSSSDSSTSSMLDSIDCWAKLSSPSAAIQPFAQQDSQCGMESLRTDFSLSSHGHSHHHQLPMDSLVSSAYSPT